VSIILDIILLFEGGRVFDGVMPDWTIIFIIAVRILWFSNLGEIYCFCGYHVPMTPTIGLVFCALINYNFFIFLCVLSYDVNVISFKYNYLSYFVIGSVFRKVQEPFYVLLKCHHGIHNYRKLHSMIIVALSIITMTFLRIILHLC